MGSWSIGWLKICLICCLYTGIACRIINLTVQYNNLTYNEKKKLFWFLRKTIFEEVCYSTSLQLVEGDQSLKFTNIQIWSAPEPTRACGRGRGNRWSHATPFKLDFFSILVDFWCCLFILFGLFSLASFGIKPRHENLISFWGFKASLRLLKVF